MKFISLLKPGIIFGNLVTLSGGYFLASHQHFYVWPWIWTLLGMSLVVGSGCVFNNLIDRDIDRLMQRTCRRVLAQGQISPTVAVIYGTVLGVLGFLILATLTHWLTVVLAAIGFLVYVVVYSLCLKRRSRYGVIVGGIAGAIPPMVGYVAASHRLDTGAWLLFALLFLWQMPHFYAIAIYRLEDFQKAHLPVLPLTKGIPATKRSILRYVAIFTVVATLPAWLGYAGIAYGSIALVFGLVWIYLCLQGFSTPDDKAWARKNFGFSILTITVLSVMMLF